MQTAHRVTKRRRLDSQDGHRKWLLVILGPEPSQGQEFVERHSALAAILAEIFIQQPRIEKVDAGWNRSVGCEYVVGTASFKSFIERQLLLLNQKSHPLHGQERGVAFIH